MVTRTANLNPGRMLLAGVLTALVALLAVGAGVSRAAACDTTWTGSAHGDWNTDGNWDHGSPDSTMNACITGSGPVAITGESAQAKSLTLSGTQLDLTGNT